MHQLDVLWKPHFRMEHDTFEEHTLDFVILFLTCSRFLLVVRPAYLHLLRKLCRMFAHKAFV